MNLLITCVFIHAINGLLRGEVRRISEFRDILSTAINAFLAKNILRS